MRVGDTLGECMQRLVERYETVSPSKVGLPRLFLCEASMHYIGYLVWRRWDRRGRRGARDVIDCGRPGEAF